jgi:hypothetical protein
MLFSWSFWRDETTSKFRNGPSMSLPTLSNVLVQLERAPI